jgi:hypothetical protein
MTLGPGRLEDEYFTFLEGQRDSHLLEHAEINSLYQDHLDGMRDAYLDEAGE